MESFNYEKANIVDTMRLVSELEHHRWHILMALPYAEEEEKITLLVLAKQCQDLRREIMRKNFIVEERYWCLMKTSSRLMQLAEETTTDDSEMVKKVKNIVDQTVLLATGEDISGCQACRKDKDE